MSLETTGLVFDVATTLGLGPANKQPLPGEIILRVPEGISLLSLRDSEVGKALMCQQDWYYTLEWSKTPLPVGTYRIRLPIPGSNRMTFVKQQTLLRTKESVAPVTLVALALLCLQKQNLSDPLNGGWVRCRETAAGGARVELTWNDGRLRVDGYWNGYRIGNVWAAGARKL